MEERRVVAHGYGEEESERPSDPSHLLEKVLLRASATKKIQTSHHRRGGWVGGGGGHLEADASINEFQGGCEKNAMLAQPGMVPHDQYGY